MTLKEFILFVLVCIVVMVYQYNYGQLQRANAEVMNNKLTTDDLKIILKDTKDRLVKMTIVMKKVRRILKYRGTKTQARGLRTDRCGRWQGGLMCLDVFLVLVWFIAGILIGYAASKINI